MQRTLFKTNKHSLARRLIVAVVLFSALLTLVISAVQLFRDYRLDVSSIESRIKQIEDVSLKTLTNNLWVADTQEMQTHINALRNLPDMQYLEIRDGDKLWAKAGTPKEGNVILREFPMTYDYRDQNLTLGSLTVIATLDGVMQRIMDKVVIILVSNGIKTFFVAGFILIVFQFMVTRHLEKIALFVKSSEMEALDRQLVLDRKDKPRLRRDELGVVVSALNEMIAGLKSSYHSIKQREEHVRLLLNSTAEAIYGVDKAGICTFVNPACLSMLGYEDEEDLIGRNMHDLIHHTRTDGSPYPGEECKIAIATMAGEISHSDDELYWRCDGSGFPVEYWSHPIVHEDAIVGSVVTFFDITERLQVERELHEHRENLQKLVDERTAELNQQATIIDQIHDSVVSTDMQGMITSWNKGAERLFGYSAQEAIGQSIAFVYPEEEHEYLQNEVIRGLLDKGEYETEVRMRRKSGEDFFAHLSLSMRLDESGQAIGMIGYSMDITQRKQAEEELAQQAAALEASNRELEAFSYSVSHDLRSPLRAIDGFSYALLEDYYDALDDTGKDYLQRVRNGSQRMGVLIDSMLKLSRVTRSDFHQEQVDLTQIAKRIFHRLSSLHPDRRVDFQIQESLYCVGDTQLLEIMMENLLGNAWKYTSKEEVAKIEFGKYQEKGIDVFFIKDNGAGFDMAYANKLFTAFHRLHRVEDYEGSGIGLAIVQRIISRHNGRVWVDAEEGEGATFYFSL